MWARHLSHILLSFTCLMSQLVALSDMYISLCLLSYTVALRIFTIWTLKGFLSLNWLSPTSLSLSGVDHKYSLLYFLSNFGVLIMLEKRYWPNIIATLIGRCVKNINWPNKQNPTLNRMMAKSINCILAQQHIFINRPMCKIINWPNTNFTSIGQCTKKSIGPTNKILLLTE